MTDNGGDATQPAAGTPRRPSLSDAVAGLCVAGLLIPEAVAYAGLAHVPVPHALVAALLGLGLYALFGGSRFAVVAPTSSTAALAAAAVLGADGASTPEHYLALMLALVLAAGAILMLLAWARQGQLSAFVARPVLRGFAFALAISIVIKQLPDVLGVVPAAGEGGDPLRLLLYLLGHVQDWHAAPMAVAAAAAAPLVLLRRWPVLPASLLVMVLAIVGAQALGLRAYGVAEVGAVAAPGFRPAWPALAPNEWLRMGELAFGLVVLIFAESWGSMRTLALAHGDTLDANRELLVLGACNVASGLFQGMPVGAGFSASTANAAAGAQSRWAGAVALAVMGAALLLALPALHLLPRAVLAVAVISALWHALSAAPLLATWKLERDRTLVVAAIVAVLLLGVLDGMLAAIALSLLAALRRFSQPVVHELGQLGDSHNFVGLEVNSSAQRVPGLLVLRPEEPLFFASAERVAADITQRLAAHPEARVVVLSLEESADLDSTAVECLLELHQRLHRQGKHLALARVKETVRALLLKVDPEGLGREARMFWSVADAADAMRTPPAAPAPAPQNMGH
jgi:MFS superfamily sulfate permease-like transporter